jgi:hypothetical protein
MLCCLLVSNFVSHLVRGLVAIQNKRSHEDFNLYTVADLKMQEMGSEKHPDWPLDLVTSW